MNIPVNQFPSIEQMTERLSPGKKMNAGNYNQIPGTSFEELLIGKQKEIDSGALKFSKHANERLSSRNIDLTKDQYQRLENGAKKAQEKGIKESLVMVDNLAFVVNVKNNTVITAVKDGEEKVFTNIDGAVII